MRHGREAGVAGARVAVGLAGALGAGCLALVAFIVARTPDRDHSPLVVVPALVAVGAVGAAVVWRRPVQRMGWLLLTVPLVGLVAGAAAYGLLFHADRAGDGGPAVLVAQILVLIDDLAIFATLSVVFLSFPNGRLLSVRWWGAVGLTTVAYLLTRASVVTEPHPVMATFPDLASPSAAVGLPTWLTTLQPVATLAFLAWPIAVVVRYRRSVGAERLQARWLAYTTVVWVIFLVAAALGPPGGALARRPRAASAGAGGPALRAVRHRPHRRPHPPVRSVDRRRHGRLRRGRHRSEPARPAPRRPGRIPHRDRGRGARVSAAAAPAAIGGQPPALR